MKQFLKSATLLVASVVIAFGAYSCSVTPIDQAKLEGHWVLEELNGKGVKEYKAMATPTLEFNFTDSLVAGTSGCNRYHGAFVLDAQNVFSAPVLASTMMACMDMEIEDVFNQAISTENLEVSLEGETLKFAKDGKTVLVFKKGEKVEITAAVTLEGLQGDWKLVSMANEDVVKLFGDRVPTMTFAEDGKVFGFAGCNRFNSTYALADSKLTLTMPASTRMACDHLEGEGKFTTALEGEYGVSIIANQLSFFKEDGIVVLAFERTELEK